MSGIEIPLNSPKRRRRMSGKIMTYSTVILVLASNIVAYFPGLYSTIGNSGYQLFNEVLCGGVIFAWSIACYTEAYAINSLRKERLAKGIQSNGDKLAIVFWFTSFLLLLIPTIIVAFMLIARV